MSEKSDFLNKNGIYKIIAEKNPDLSSEKVTKAVDLFFDEISTALACGDKVQLRKFASLSVRKRCSRSVRNPKLNTVVEIGDRGSLYFRASQDLLKELNASDISNDNS